MATVIKVKYDNLYARKIRVDIGGLFQLLTIDEAKELQTKLNEAIKQHKEN